jgi:uncharacterized damage-inducible protein DinB
MRVAMGLVFGSLIGMGTAMAQTANPVVSSAREMFNRQSGFMMAAAAEMPADKYGFRPTADQWTFGKVVAHVVEGNNFVCGMMAGTPAPAGAKVTEASSKEQLSGALKASFAYCATTLDGLKDSQMGDPIKFFGGAPKPKARALLEIVGDLEDHYAQMAMYLRLNGMVPPSATVKH